MKPSVNKKSKAKKEDDAGTEFTPVKCLYTKLKPVSDKLQVYTKYR